MKGQTSLPLPIISVMILVIIGISAVIPVLKDQVNTATSLGTITNQVLTFNTLSNVSLGVEDIVQGSDTLVNASNTAQTAFARDTDYTLSLGSSVTSGSITWLQNYTTNVTNTSTGHFTSGSQVGVNVTFPAKNATFTAQNHILRIEIFNSSIGSVAGTALIRFNGNTLSNVSLAAGGTGTNFTFSNVSGSYFTADSRPIVTVIGSTGTNISINSSTLQQNGGERVLASYQYKPDGYLDNATQRTLLTLITLFVAIGLLLFLARMMGFL